MSGVQIVRTLQADARGKTRYVNVPTYLPPAGTTQAARYQVAQAKAGSVDIESKIKALEQATSKSKKSSAVNKHKKEWLQESQRLSKLRDELEGELQEILDRLEQDRDPAAPPEEARRSVRPVSKERPDADESVELEEEGGDQKEEEEQEEAVDMARQLAAIDFECKKARLLLFHELMADVEQSREVVKSLAGAPGGSLLARRQLQSARERFDAWGAEAYGAQLAEEAAAAAAEAATDDGAASDRSYAGAPDRGSGAGDGGGAAATPDPRLAALFVERFSELDLRYIGQLKGYKEELEAAEAAGRGPDAAAWDEPARFHFRKIYEEYEKKGLGRDAICERLALEMPARRRMDIEAFHDQHARQRYYHAKRKAALSAWGAAREALAREAERAFAESVREGRERAEREAELRAFEARRGELRERLRGMREAAEARAAELAELERRQAEEEAARAEARSAEERAAREARRKLIGEYRAAQRAEQERMRAAEEEARRAEEEEARARLLVRGWRRRRGWRRGRRSGAEGGGERERAAERERERAEREARLARLRETVAPVVESDPARLLRPTAAMVSGEAAAAASASGSAGPSGKELFPVHGYTVDQLFSDTRFKLTVALREAGLAHMPYAQEMIARAVPRTQPRVDSYTSGQLDAMAAAKMGLPPPP
eukprot:tig00022099_g23805.t1